MVWNLLSNAVKFTPKGGRVQVRLERVNSHVEIIVSDSGIGISKEFLPLVFDRFRQADSGSTRKTGGLGLGLSIVRHLVEMHGGTRPRGERRCRSGRDVHGAAAGDGGAAVAVGQARASACGIDATRFSSSRISAAFACLPSTMTPTRLAC